MVYREGDPGSPVYLVEEGLVAVELVVPGRGAVTILTVGPGEIFGWSSLFYQRPKTSAARAAGADPGSGAGLGPAPCTLRR